MTRKIVIADAATQEADVIKESELLKSGGSELEIVKVDVLDNFSGTPVSETTLLVGDAQNLANNSKILEDIGDKILVPGGKLRVKLLSQPEELKGIITRKLKYSGFVNVQKEADSEYICGETQKLVC